MSIEGTILLLTFAACMFSVAGFLWLQERDRRCQ